MSAFECVRAREVFLAAYSNATQQGNSHELAVRLGLDAVWMRAASIRQRSRKPLPRALLWGCWNEGQDYIHPGA